MAYNETPTITWDRTTPRDGLLFSAEFARIYDAIANYIVANGGSAPPKTMKAMSDLLDATVNVTGDQTIAGVKTFSSAIVSDVTGDVTGNADTATLADGASSIKETGSGAGTVRKKIIEIGDWDMNSFTDIGVEHGMADTSKIRSISALIRNNAGTVMKPLNSVKTATGELNGGVVGRNGIFIDLTRVVGGVFDSTDYDSTSYNRGWIVIEYVD
jgi:hypothetical protein